MKTAPQELLKEYIQSQHFTSTAEIMQAFGGPFDPTYYTDYLERKFTEVYGL